MVSELVRAVAKGIYEHWEGKVPVYTEKVYQNAEKPCFFAECSSIKRVKLLGGRYFLRCTITVTAENDSEMCGLETESMMDGLFYVMNFVSLGDFKIHAVSLTGERENNAFKAVGVYDIFTHTDDAEDTWLMESIEIKEEECGIH